MHLVVAVRKVRPQLQAVESRRTRAGKSRILGAAPILSEHILLSRNRGKTRIAPQIGVVVEILAVLDALWIARIGEALGNHATDTQTRIDLAQKKKSSIGAQSPAREIGNDFSKTQDLKKHRLGVTGCLTGGGMRLVIMMFYAK
jgi:hypothetical protein